MTFHQCTNNRLNVHTVVVLLGGEEGVLVVWQVATSVKSFIPRLGAPVNAIAVRSVLSTRFRMSRCY